MRRDLKILLVEDAPEVQLMVKASLGKKYSLTCVESAEEARKELQSKRFSLLIFDVELPGEDGFKLCANVRTDPAHKAVPIIFLTGKHQTRDKVLAFSIGADDYIVKPLDIAEFQARIESKMRRLQESKEEFDHITIGQFRVALAEQTIYLGENGKERNLRLSTIEFKLLYYFLKHENHVLSRPQILDSVWGTGVHVSDRAVDTYVYALRKKLGSFGEMIQSVPRVGYRLSLSETAHTA